MQDDLLISSVLPDELRSSSYVSNATEVKAAGEVSPTSRSLTGPAFAPAHGLRAGNGGVFIVPQTGS